MILNHIILLKYSMKCLRLSINIRMYCAIILQRFYSDLISNQRMVSKSLEMNIKVSKNLMFFRIIYPY
jgi:hypothetical protein